MVFGFSLRMITNDDGFSQLDEDQRLRFCPLEIERGKLLCSIGEGGKEGMGSSSSWPLVSFFRR